MAKQQRKEVEIQRFKMDNRIDKKRMMKNINKVNGELPRQRNNGC